MATVLAPRVYGLDAICAAALATAARRRPISPAASMPASPTRTWPALPPTNAPAPRLSLLAFARRRLPGVAKVRVFNPTAADHGFESRHTIVQIVNDDMPFLVDSIANEFNRREINVHLLAHPVLAVRRDLDGDLLGLRRRSRRARQARIDDAHRDRPPGRSGAARRACRRARRACWPRCGWRSRTGGRCAAPASTPSPISRPAARRPRRVRRFPALAGGQPFHLPRPSPLSLRRGRRAGRRPALRDRAGLGARHPAPRRGAAVRGRPRRRRGDVALRPRAGQHPDRQDRPPLAGPSQRADGLRDRQDLRRRRPRHRRAALRRPVHLGRLSRHGARRAAAARPRRQHRCGARASTRTATTARRCSPSWKPIRATSCSRSTRTRSTTTRWASCSCRSGAAWRCSPAATPSAASPPAWCSRRASASTPRSATSSPHLLEQAWHGKVTVESTSRSAAIRRWPRRSTR